MKPLILKIVVSTCSRLTWFEAAPQINVRLEINKSGSLVLCHLLLISENFGKSVMESSFSFVIQNIRVSSLPRPPRLHDKRCIYTGFSLTLN